MRTLCLQIKQTLRAMIFDAPSRSARWLQLGIQAIVVGSLLLVLMKKDLNFQFELRAVADQFSDATLEEASENPPVQKAATMHFGANLLPAFRHASKAEQPTTAHDNVGNTYSNMTYEGGTSAKGSGSLNAAAIKRKKQLAYVRRFAHVAQAEQKKYGIPASITLAQGLIESNAGESRLSRENNNHFGMKCFSKKCKKGHCSNFTDDSHKDFFRKYQTAWESYRSHSLMLKHGQRYRNLFRLPASDYKAWANGLSKAGYATDKRYAQKLIHIINDLGLAKYDRKASGR
ncbi:MAG: glucosaminidase domain-containing protein [Bacteroidota bacterium]